MSRTVLCCVVMSVAVHSGLVFADDAPSWWAQPLGCEAARSSQARFTPREPAEVTVQQLAVRRAAHAVVTVDANALETRRREGVIEGAVLLTATADYRLDELPADRATALVFYSADGQCGAAHLAARRALEAGFTDVAVLPVGVRGWKAAGQPTVSAPGC